jgi:sortase A
VVKLPQRPATRNEPDNEAHELLHSLLHSSVPSSAENETLRPATLRSRSRQRREALKPFLLRTWVDYTLRHIERVLVLILIGFFTIWFLDGYGRDLLHAWQQRTASQPAHNASPSAALPIDETFDRGSAEQVISRHSSPVALNIGTDDNVSLPFVPEDSVDKDTTLSSHTAAAPDFLAPRNMSVPQQRVDPRPHRLFIPAIEVDTPVEEVFIEDGAWQVAEYAAGYHHGTALPGDGNTVIAGHAGLRGAVFRNLGALSTGDEVVIEAGGWQYTYEVQQTMNVWPTQVEVMAATSDARITLITCTAWDTQRLVVIAKLVDSSLL